MLGTIKHYLSSFSKYLVNNCSMKSIAVEPVKGLKKDKNLSSKSLLTTWGDNGRRDMQAKRHHYKATENMQKKKKRLQSAVEVQKRNHPLWSLCGR